MRQVTETMAKTAMRLYDQLLSNAEQEELEQGVFTVFRGSLLQQFTQVSETRQHYTPCYSLLKITNCISVLDLGGRATGSVVVLHGAPELQDLLNVDPSHLTGDRGHGMLMVEAQMKDLLKRFQGLDIVAALDNHENRIAALENNKGEK